MSRKKKQRPVKTPMTEIQQRAESTYFIVADSVYAEACRKGLANVVDKLYLARLTKIPTIVIWVDPITREDEDTVRKALLGVSVIFETRCVNSDESVENAILSIKEFLSK